MKHAYPYIRWSSAPQDKGNSLARQSQSIAKWLEGRGYIVEPEIIEEGQSAYEGLNLAPGGKLHKFISDVEAGLIPAGSLLVMESLDRFSRQDWKQATPHLQRVLNRGVSVAITSKDKVYDSNYNQFDLFQAIFELSQANEESVKKSGRVRSARQDRITRMLNGEKLGWLGIPPRWLDWNKDKKDFEFNRNAPAYRECFYLSARGYGSIEILKQVNERFAGEISIRGKKGVVEEKLSISTVAQLLNNPAVYGRYTAKDGRFRDDYFPALVSKELYDQSQAALAQRREQGSGLRAPKRNRYVTKDPAPHTLNWLAGSLYCSCCGGKIYLVHNKRRDGYQSVFYCHARKSGKSKDCTFAPIDQTTLESHCWQWLDDNHKLVNQQDIYRRSKLAELKSALVAAEKDYAEKGQTLRSHYSQVMAEVASDAEKLVTQIKKDIALLSLQIQDLPEDWSSDDGRERLSTIVKLLGATFEVWNSDGLFSVTAHYKGQQDPIFVPPPISAEDFQSGAVTELGEVDG